MSTNIQAIKTYLLQLQNDICQQLEQEDGAAKFQQDIWQREQNGGGGQTRILENGQIIEKAGVNFSHVLGSELPASIIQQRPELKNCRYEAMGVSAVIHPRNPYAPTTHLNVRFFQAHRDNAAPIWWFGGGFDLTPYYGFEEDCVHWHQTAKAACAPYGDAVYAQYKQACDDYFFLRHRNEPRGIGGLFFDNLNVWEFEKCFAFMRSVGDHFIPAYRPLLARRKNWQYSDAEREFQCYRRGRYVEFNLIYDRGTLFGLQTGGRSESILISLPPAVTWHYNVQLQPGTKEAALYQDFLKPRDWV